MTMVFRAEVVFILGIYKQWTYGCMYAAKLFYLLFSSYKKIH